MSIDNDKKKKLIDEFKTSENDTGSVEVQVSVLTERIKSVTEHCKAHAKDFSAKRGLLMLVQRRKRLLSYLKRKSLVRFNNLIKKLGLKGIKE